MITVITGTPGAGKTLYSISKLLLPLVGTNVFDAETGLEVPRKIYTNIRGLTIDHELIDGSAEGGLRNWHQWAKPGAVIVFDEVQKIWEPRANGSKVPDDIKALETHRHMGVDFVLITQGLMLTERNLAMLCNRHLHVRRVANLPFAIVYEWDHASRTLLYSKAIAKQPWRYDKKVFKLYKSADLHTKQPRRIPSLVWLILAGVGLLAYLGPTVKNRLSERMNPTAAQHTSPDTSKDAGAKGVQPGGTAGASKRIDDAVDWTPRVSALPESAPAFDDLRKVVAMPVVAGGLMKGKVARCFTQQGTDAGLTSEQCRAWMESPRFDPYKAQTAAVAPMPSVQRENGPEARSGPSLVVFEGTGFRDPQGYNGTQTSRK